MFIFCWLLTIFILRYSMWDGQSFTTVPCMKTTNPWINHSFTLRNKYDNSAGWSYFGNGWTCGDNVSLINKISESQKCIYLTIINMQRDGVPCYFESNGTIIPPLYCKPVITQRNDDLSAFCDDFQFGSPNTNDVELFVPSNISMTKSSQ